MLTQSQLQTIKNEILADPVLNAYPNTADGNFAIAAALNLTAVPAWWVWRQHVSKADFVQGASIDGTVFNWTGTGFITRSAGERDAWREMFNGEGFANPSLANVRQAFLDIFSGAIEPAPSNRTHLRAVARRTASRVEKILATGTGSTSAPGTMTFEGAISFQDVQDARNLP